MVARRRRRRSRRAAEHPGMTESLPTPESPAAADPSPTGATPSRAGLSRRRLLVAGAGAAGAAGLSGAIALSGPALAAGPGSPLLWLRPDHAGAPEVHGLHLQFGADAAREVVVSWFTPVSVDAPHVVVGTPEDGFGREFAARTITYTDAASGTEVFIHHARVGGLRPDTEYLYAAAHGGTTVIPGLFRTAPAGRAPLTFTSFGDQGTPTLGKSTVPAGSNPPIFVSDNLGGPFGADTVVGIERIAPLFHLVNGDLCYANIATDRIRTWSDWFTNNSRSARFRPWMPAAGNHENELGNGPIGYGAYQSYFAVPSPDGDPLTRGLWYSFTAGSVRVISLNNDDVCYQDGGNSYVRGYSAGAQKSFRAA